MENIVTDLFESPASDIDQGDLKDIDMKEQKASALKTSMMMQAMDVMKDPKKVKRIAIFAISFFLIGLGYSIYVVMVHPYTLLAIGIYFIFSFLWKMIKVYRDQRIKNKG